MYCLSQTRYEQVSGRRARAVRVIHWLEDRRWWWGGNRNRLRIGSGRWSSARSAIGARSNAQRVSGHRMTSEPLLSWPKYRRTPLRRYGVNELTTASRCLLDAISFWIDCVGVDACVPLCRKAGSPELWRHYKGSWDQGPSARAEVEGHVPFTNGNCDLHRVK